MVGFLDVTLWDFRSNWPEPSLNIFKFHRKCWLKRHRMWELWVEFYLGQIEDFRPGASASDNSKRLLQTGSGGGSVTQSCPSLCDPRGCNTPGFPVLYHVLQLAQIHVNWVGDTILPSHPLSSTSLPAFHVSEHHGLSQWLGSCIWWPQYWNFSISPSSEYSGLISFSIDWVDLLQSKGLLRVFSNTTVQKHYFFATQPSLCFNSYIHTWLQEKP